MPKTKNVTAVLACGGKSLRMGENKLLINLCGKSCLRRSAEAVLSSPDVKTLIVAAPEDMTEKYSEELSGLRLKPLFAPAGATRSESVKNAAELSRDSLILIHDGARPLVSPEEVQSSIDDAFIYGSSVVCTPQKDTVRYSDGEKSFCPNRDLLYTVRTPQTFERSLYLKMLNACEPGITDDSQLLDAIGRVPHITLGSFRNIKLTTPDDVSLARILLGEMNMSTNMNFRIGHGYDVHRLVEGRALILGGVNIPCEKGLLGHSDADVLVHAIIDSLLGAAALGDIGKLFPDNDPKYSGADSIKLLERVTEYVSEKGFKPINVDATVIAQAPKLSPYIEKMRERIAEAMKTEVDKISVKATTEERLGFTGSGEGIAAHAVCLLEGRALEG